MFEHEQHERLNQNERAEADVGALFAEQLPEFVF
jgi:hypothetical protein